MSNSIITNLHISIYDDDDSLLKALVKGLEDNCKSTKPVFSYVKIMFTGVDEERMKITMFLLMKANILSQIKEIVFRNIKCKLTFLSEFTELLGNLHFIKFSNVYFESWKWISSLKPLLKLKILHIHGTASPCIAPPADFGSHLFDKKLTEIVIDVYFPSNTPYYNLHISTDDMVNSLLKSVLRSKQITQVCLPNISRETMAGVHSILLHCPSLVSLELERTRLGYDGILYICSALKSNSSLKYLLINDREGTAHTMMKTVPDKTTCTDFLLELNNILENNSTLEKIDVQCKLFLPFVPDEPLTNRGTTLAPLQHFNLGAICSGRSPNIKRSFSSSDLIEAKTVLHSKQLLKSPTCVHVVMDNNSI